ncbi:MAG TPA: FmdB family zinc ribbon protein [Dehalococcoidia bacterium]|nr:FmdB family zinc ribbon protein [Dehalococcoidia bacterium]
MPLYEYYCPPCSSQFEVLRPVSQMDRPAVCPSGHTTNNRVLSMFSVPRGAVEGGTSTMTMTGGDDCCSPGMGHSGCSCC